MVYTAIEPNDPQPHSLYAHVNTNWLHMDLSVFVKKNSVWFCIKNLELRRILMSLAFRIAIYPKGLIKCLNYFIVFRTVEIV